MEIPQIKRIILRLHPRRLRKTAAQRFELKHNNRAIRDQNGINDAPQPDQRIFQQQTPRARQTRQCTMQNLNLPAPGPQLRITIRRMRFNRPRSQATYNALFALRSKGFYGSRPPCPRNCIIHAPLIAC